MPRALTAVRRRPGFPRGVAEHHIHLPPEARGMAERQRAPVRESPRMTCALAMQHVLEVKPNELHAVDVELRVRLLMREDPTGKEVRPLIQRCPASA